MKRGYYRAVAWGTGLCSFIAPVVSAVVFYSTGDPHHNTTAPTGELAGSGWELQGDAFSGIPIAPNFFITATHVGGKVGGVFGFQGLEYPMIASFHHPDADITIWKVNGTFPQYAQLYRSSDEIGKPLVVFGRGTQRGNEIGMNGALKGWAWGTIDGLLRWGENVVAGISDEDGKPATSETKFQLLRADFDQNGGRNEAHLSGGDSGGGVFIRDGGVWKLAGVNHGADKEYSFTATGDEFMATLFDEGGFFEGEEGKREYHPDDPSSPQPGSFHATRISAYIGWIESIIGSVNSTADIFLGEAPELFGPYTPAAGAIVASLTLL
ncbi:MAG: hypothetical protein L0Z50_18510 [Verrucomicrobiales bacterium]|nr:hypothetical protein [Verrucomicrobiales bacterium]